MKKSIALINRKRNNLSKSKKCLRIITVGAVIKYLLETGIWIYMLYNNKIFLYILNFTSLC